MRIIRNIKNIQELTRDLRRKGKSIGFVPTMGALHNGHISLIKRARKENDIVAVSIFVNPTQFGKNEDFQGYPRNLATDRILCKREGVDIIFYPNINKIYPIGYKTYVLTEQLSDVLCGKFRPGHFKGVTTIVTKLFNIIQPDVAYFGQKDAQQAIIIKQMTKDLNFPVKIKVVSTVREFDGLALSSRNSYLTTKQRNDVAVLFRALSAAGAMIKQGITDSGRIISRMRRIIKQKKSTRIQYIQIVNLNELKPVKKVHGSVLIALAVFIGRTRLIDNIVIN